MSDTSKQRIGKNRDDMQAAGGGVGASGSQPKEASYDLGKLNRHWYRLRLDVLDQHLRDSPQDPSIKDLEKLSKKIISSFLAAVAGQAPTSTRVQFPADRAYFIPFDGDMARSFNFAKPIYRFVKDLETYSNTKQKDRHFPNSIWSFLPWPEEGGELEIDAERSVDDKLRTIDFERMISARAQFTTREMGKSEELGNLEFLLEKALIMRSDEAGNYLKEVFEDGGETFRKKMSDACEETIQAIFEIYRKNPGNAAVERILLNHLTLVLWVMAQKEHLTEVVPAQDGDYIQLFNAFLRSLFFSGVSFGDLRSNEKEEGMIQRLATRLIEGSDSVQRPASSKEPATGPDLPEGASEDPHTADDGELKQFREKRRAVLKQLREKRWAKEEGKSKSRTREAIKPEDFDALLGDIRTFRRYLLKGESESRIEKDLEASLGSKLSKAGNSQQSFVWVIPDFEDMDYSLPIEFQVNKNEKDAVRDLAPSLNRVYSTFFERCDVVSFGNKERREQIQAYWRTLGDAGRPKKIFGSFEIPEIEMYIPEISVLQKTESGSEEPIPIGAVAAARSQNFFLRVKVCDSLGEPVINGLFVISTDHDEHRFKSKTVDLRKEDQEDLIAFAKVYFFIVRDYLIALDSAQDARDIGRLNQYLYEERLVDLDRRMESRVQEPQFVESGLAHKRNWSKFIYEVYNNYAASLIEKPDAVKVETFPYDRLLIVPLEMEKDDKHTDKHALPFYLFQTIIAERVKGEIDPRHYALIKSFQSPIDDLSDQKAKDRFASKSFQRTSRGDRQAGLLPSYLEKLYLGAVQDSDRLGALTNPSAPESESVDRERLEKESLPPESYVPKLALATDSSTSGADSSSKAAATLPTDRGRDWIQRAISTFWSRLTVGEKAESGPRLWRDFLNGLTVDYQIIKNRKNKEMEAGSEDLWFLFRFGLLRSILRQADTEALTAIMSDYESDLRLRFDADEGLDVITLAQDWESDPFDSLAAALPFLKEREQAKVRFLQIKLGGDGKQIPQDDQFVLEFFRHLTELVTNKSQGRAESNSESEKELTWYQPLLTRPFEEPDSVGTSLNVHRAAGGAIGGRTPPYEEIEEGLHGLAMFLGFANFRVGRGAQRTQVRCLIAMIRDYDDTKTGAGRLEGEIDAQLEVDLRDLSAYTSTFFRNVQKFGADTMATENIRLLSTDINQMARNWYSSGMDDIAGRLGRKVQLLLEDPSDLKLGRLRPELMDEFFDSILDLMTRQEIKPNAEGSPIPLESFPFDRLLHIPLTSDDPESFRLGYSRTEVVPPEKSNEADKTPWSYRQIRRDGRTWTSIGWGKKPACKVHDGLTATQGDEGARITWSSEVVAVIVRIGADDRLFDSFISRLYQADPLQRLSLAGLIRHILQVAPEGSLPGGDPDLDRCRPEMKKRLDAVIIDSIRSVEQADGGSSKSIFSAVEMDPDAFLPRLSAGEYKEKEGDKKGAALFASSLGDKTCLPVWAELFQAAEKGDPKWIYGLKDEKDKKHQVRSKIFYVYYSISAPSSLADVPANTRYRGILSFIVDDARTDLKSKAAQEADKQDIRTLVHNSVRGFRQALLIQGLENENRQPGIERFVLGMLHRLKNELGYPVTVLRDLASQVKRKEDVKRIESATNTITGFGDLFKGLRDLTEHEQGLAPLRSFSTDWLGWFFVTRLCTTALNVMRDAELDASEEGRDGLQRIEHIRVAAADEKSADQSSSYTVDLIQRRLRDLESEVRRLAKRAFGKEMDLDLIFSFQVFAGGPMEFIGSFLLEEALSVLIENAFQAFWSDLISGGGPSRRGSRRPFGLVKLVCRRQEALLSGELEAEATGEILVEITNTSAVIADSIISVLNAEVPQTMTKHQHASASGKKGGSGFGHYYARRIIRGFCGGREERRKLDVKISYNRERAQCQVSTNLIEVVRSEVQQITGTELKQKVETVLHTKVSLESQVEKREFGLPANIPLKNLLEVTRNILRADRQQIEEKVLSWLSESVCGRIARSCDKVRTELIKVLKSKIEKGVESAGVGSFEDRLEKIESDGIVRVRRSSYVDLEVFLRQWRKQDPESLGEVVTARPLLKRMLGKYAVSGDLSPSSFIESRYRKGIQGTFDIYASYLKADDAKASLEYALADLDQREGGIPVPDRRRILRMFLPVQERVELRPIPGGIHLVFSLDDREETTMAESCSIATDGLPEHGAEEQDDFVVRFRLGSTFRCYAREFRTQDVNGDRPQGALWLELVHPPAGLRGQGASRAVHLVLRDREAEETPSQID